uniref:Uncharacterized protein n=1 Tax=Arundo donax TaxID=35708 RepID=A0A0A9C079_ARUDO
MHNLFPSLKAVLTFYFPFSTYFIS